MQKQNDRNRETTDRSEGGFTLLEIVMTGAVLAIGACGMASVLVQSMTVTAVNRETTLARQAARQVLEQIVDIPAGQVYTVFSATDPRAKDVYVEEDPAFTTESQTYYATESLTMNSQFSDVSGMTASVIFPADLGGYSLREDVTDKALGMPRDLNGDGVIDSENHADDYVLLPVRVRVNWKGITGERSFEVCTVLLNE